MSLRALQRDLRAWLTHEDQQAAARIGDAAAPGLRVYQNNYRAQLVTCLQMTFAKTRAWLGDGAFLAAAARHVDRVPPSSWTLDAYGRDFPATVEMIYPDDHEVAELAALELAMEEVFIGPDADPLATSDLAAIDWVRAIIRLTPALDIIPARSNAAMIWSSLSSGQIPPAAHALAEPAAMLVWRQGYRSMLRIVDRAELDALVRIRAGLPFAQLCAETSEALGEREATTLMGRWLGRWMMDGLIVGVTGQD